MLSVLTDLLVTLTIVGIPLSFLAMTLSMTVYYHVDRSNRFTHVSITVSLTHIVNSITTSMKEHRDFLSSLLLVCSLLCLWFSFVSLNPKP